jgi:hypothetical protein
MATPYSRAGTGEITTIPRAGVISTTTAGFFSKQEFTALKKTLAELDNKAPSTLRALVEKQSLTAADKEALKAVGIGTDETALQNARTIQAEVTRLGGGAPEVFLRGAGGRPIFPEDLDATTRELRGVINKLTPAQTTELKDLLTGGEQIIKDKQLGSLLARSGLSESGYIIGQDLQLMGPELAQNLRTEFAAAAQVGIEKAATVTMANSGIAKQAFAKVAPKLGTVSKYAPMLTVVDVGYETYAEDGSFINKDGSLGHKGERLAAASVSAAANLGTGAMLTSGTMTVGGTVVAGTTTGVAEATAAGAVVTDGVMAGGVAGAATVAAPVVLVAAATYATAKTAELAIQNRRSYEGLDKDTSTFFQATRFAERPSGTNLSIYNFRNLPAVLYVSQHMRDDQLSAPLKRTPSGTVMDADFRKLDMSNPKNLREFERAIALEVNKQQQIMRDNDSALPRWVRSGDSVTKYNLANVALKQLRAAQGELVMYKKELETCDGAPDAAHNAGSVKQARPPAPATTLKPPTSSLKA